VEITVSQECKLLVHTGDSTHIREAVASMIVRLACDVEGAMPSDFNGL
jgi:hypothetical protein